jgi:hypothetical protein
MRNGRRTGSPVSCLLSAFDSVPPMSIARTRVYCRIDDFLCVPQLRRHLLDLARLVSGDQLFGIFEAGRRSEQGPASCAWSVVRSEDDQQSWLKRPLQLKSTSTTNEAHMQVKGRGLTTSPYPIIIASLRSCLTSGLKCWRRVARDPSTLSGRTESLGGRAFQAKKKS